MNEGIYEEGPREVTLNPIPRCNAYIALYVVAQ